MEHNESDICARHRPTTSPEWVADAIARHEVATTASNLFAMNVEGLIARRELAEGVSTREWAGEPPAPSPTMVHALLRAMGVRNGKATG